VPLPAAWSPLRRRQFEHVKASLLAQGRTPAKAAELAARTVNKARRAAGEAQPERRGVDRGGRRRTPERSRVGSEDQVGQNAQRRFP
jgi:hypothetical protein